MNTPITFPGRPPALKLTRSVAVVPAAEEKWGVALVEERRRLAEDHDALRVREENLRAYESRLRALQEEIEQGRATAVLGGRSQTPFVRPTSTAPFESEAALQGAWEKFHRACELLAAEQAHLRDERIGAQGAEKEIKRRENAVTEREARVAARERWLAETEEASAAAQPVAAETALSAVTRLTRAPFDMARSVFGGKKS